MIRTTPRLYSAAVVAVAMSAMLRVTAAAQEKLPSWEISAEPTLVIGGDGKPETEFTRIVSVTRLASGTIAVANAGSLEIRLFSPTGVPMKSFGGRGSGPGELRMLTRMFRAGDSLLVLDGVMAGSQLHVFTEGGGYQTRASLRTASERVAPLRRFASGRFLSNRAGLRAFNARAGEVVPDSIRLDIYTPGDPGTVVALGTYPAGALLAYTLATPGPAPGIVRYRYAPQTLYETAGDRLWVGNTHDPELTVFDTSGRRLPDARLPLTPRPMDHARLDAALRREFAAAVTGDERARLSAVRDAASKERVAPIFSRLLAGADGEIWVELFREDPVEPGEFLVLRASGVPLARARAPGNVQFHEIGRDYALGVRTDEDGVEQVVVHAVRR